MASAWGRRWPDGFRRAGAGTLGDFSGYPWSPSGCAFASGGTATGAINEPNPNVRFVAVRVTGDGVAGHPGDFSSEERPWSAAGNCSVSGEDPEDPTCD